MRKCECRRLGNVGYVTCSHCISKRMMADDLESRELNGAWRRERADRVWLLMQFMVTLLFLEYRGSQDTIFLLEHCRK